MRIRLQKDVDYTGFEIQPMLNAGEDILPWEPYGYKIPITCGGTTTPIYLGQVSTVRRIKKLVLTGEEPGWNSSTQTGGERRRVFLGNGAANLANSFYVSSHFAINAPNTAYPDIDKMSINSSGSIIFGVSLDETAENFKNWLASEYSAGHPVTVWYVLATPTTGIVNEPLAKIVDYADELHSED